MIPALTATAADRAALDPATKPRARSWAPLRPR